MPRGLRRRRPAGASTSRFIERDAAAGAGRGGGAGHRRSAAPWWPRPAPASARPSPTWCRCCCRAARALVSTATKSLQDQLFLRDLPRLVEALRVPVRLALLKGRASYLCLHRLEQARARRHAARPLRGARAGRIEPGPQATRTGDLAEIDGPRRPLAGDPAGHVDARQLPGHRVPRVPRLPRDAGAARGDGGRPGGRQPPPVLRRPGVARQRRGRAAADGRRGGVRRGAPAGRDRRAVPRHAARHRPGDRLRARPAGARACSTRAACSRGRSCRRRSSARRAICGWPAPARCATCAACSSCAGTSAPALRGRCSAALDAARRGAARRRSQALRPVSEIGARLRAPARARARRWRSWPRRFAAAGAADHVRWIDVGAAACAAGRVAAGHPRAAAPSSAQAAPQGLDLHVGHAGRRRAA